ncbi:MAG: acetyl-CoA C-acyltransferase, partial [Rhodobacterales bacterium]|nr:acetyl-CoA C-acyltransferase [Rhodobacterales bacterium]
MSEAYICRGARTPIGRFGGVLSSVRPDDLLASTIRAATEHNGKLELSDIDDVIIGCANQAGEDNRNIARMALLISGLPPDVPAITINRLCGSGLNAIGMAASSIRSGEAEIILAGGVESMSRAPLVLPKPETAFSRKAEIFDTTIGWRFINPIIKNLYGIDSMPETAENVAEDFSISREDQDLFAFRSQEKAALAIGSGRLEHEIIPINLGGKSPEVISKDEHPRKADLEKLG